MTPIRLARNISKTAEDAI